MLVFCLFVIIIYYWDSENILLYGTLSVWRLINEYLYNIYLARYFINSLYVEWKSHFCKVVYYCTINIYNTRKVVIYFIHLWQQISRKGSHNEFRVVEVSAVFSYFCAVRERVPNMVNMEGEENIYFYTATDLTHVSPLTAVLTFQCILYILNLYNHL